MKIVRGAGAGNRGEMNTRKASFRGEMNTRKASFRGEMNTRKASFRGKKIVRGRGRKQGRNEYKEGKCQG
jgi:hypothetical protein